MDVQHRRLLQLPIFLQLFMFRDHRFILRNVYLSEAVFAFERLGISTPDTGEWGVSSLLEADQGGASFEEEFVHTHAG